MNRPQIINELVSTFEQTTKDATLIKEYRGELEDKTDAQLLKEYEVVGLDDRLWVRGPDLIWL